MKSKLLTLVALHLGLAAVVAQPVITSQPQSRTNLAGTTATFSVIATGALPLSYQWILNTAANRLPGETNETLTIPNVQTNHAGNYRVNVTNAAGTVQSASARLTVVVSPSFTTQPLSQVAEVGDTVTFAPAVTGTTPLGYQWRWNDTNLTGKTSTNLVLANVQFTNAGDYTLVVTNLYGAATSQVAILTLLPAVFSRVTNSILMTEVGDSLFCAWGDYDGDGFLDLMVTRASAFFAPLFQNRLYHNNRDGTFTKITNTIVTAEGRDWRSCTWADYDNDGNLDLFVTSVSASGFAAENQLFRNNSDGTFSKMGSNSVGDIVAQGDFSFEGAAWADYDNDGFLDVFIACWGPDWLIHNNGDGTFTRITNSIAPESRDSYSTAWGDFNNDGKPDLVVFGKNSPGGNLLYLNLGSGSFGLITNSPIAANTNYAFGGGWADYDNDGYLDLLVCNGGYSNRSYNDLFHNNHDGTFTRTTTNQVGDIAGQFGGFSRCTWGDYDNDGFLDLFVNASNADPSAPNHLYHNNGDGSFSRVLSGAIGKDKGSQWDCAWADYDNDGFLDLFVTALQGPQYLYHNNGNSNAWIKVRLIGTVSNRSAIGAKVRLQSVVRGNSTWQLREISSGSSPLEAHFGLGTSTNIDVVRIEWPSGIVQTLTNVAPRQILTITEPARWSVASTSAGREFILKGGRNVAYDIQRSSNLVDWSLETSLVITNLRGTATISLPQTSTDSPQTFYRAVLR